MTKNNFKIFILLCIVNFIYYTTYSFSTSLIDFSFEQILFLIMSNKIGINIDTSQLFLIIFFNSICISSMFFLLILNFRKDFPKIKDKYFLYALFLLFFISIIHFCYQLKISKYIPGFFHQSNIFKKNYVNPKNKKIIFPNKKKNLIIFFLESIETSGMSKDVGGGKNINYLPYLTKLAFNKKNISFSKNNINGAYVTKNATWTTAGIVAETAGIPLKVPFFKNPYEDSNCLDRTTTLFNILNKNKYYIMANIGSAKDFGERSSYFFNHNVNTIKDYSIVFKEENITKNYKHMWQIGLDDEILFKNAKKNLLLLAKEKQPFNFNLITSDTHFPTGYLRKNCPKRYNDQYSNVLSCSDKLIFDFISWIQKQNFYKNTTIVLVGDHILIDTEKYYSDIPQNYKRKVYFTIINPHKNAQKMLKKQNQPREFSTLDVFPTILASIGAKIEGNKLGLGVNLFSNEKTLVEKMGLKKLNVELEKRSKFYEDNFY